MPPVFFLTFGFALQFLRTILPFMLAALYKLALHSVGVTWQFSREIGNHDVNRKKSPGKSRGSTIDRRQKQSQLICETKTINIRERTHKCPFSSSVTQQTRLHAFFDSPRQFGRARHQQLTFVTAGKKVEFPTLETSLPGSPLSRAGKRRRASPHRLTGAARAQIQQQLCPRKRPAPLWVLSGHPLASCLCRPPYYSERRFTLLIVSCVRYERLGCSRRYSLCRIGATTPAFLYFWLCFVDGARFLLRIERKQE